MTAQEVTEIKMNLLKSRRPPSGKDISRLKFPRKLKKYWYLHMVRPKRIKYGYASVMWKNHARVRLQVTRDEEQKVFILNPVYCPAPKSRLSHHKSYFSKMKFRVVHLSRLDVHGS